MINGKNLESYEHKCTFYNNYEYCKDNYIKTESLFVVGKTQYRT